MTAWEDGSEEHLEDGEEKEIGKRGRRSVSFEESFAKQTRVS